MAMLVAMTDSCQRSETLPALSGTMTYDKNDNARPGDSTFEGNLLIMKYSK